METDYSNGWSLCMLYRVFSTRIRRGGKTLFFLIFKGQGKELVFSGLMLKNIDIMDNKR